RIARYLGWHILDSGALYRLAALGAIRAEIALDDIQQLSELARNLDVEYKIEGEAVMTTLGGEDVGETIRNERVGGAASIIAALPEVRAALLQRQRDFARAPGLVADGRDMGTTLFPEAELKLFLTATAEIRAQRRYKQLKQKGIDANLADLAEEIAQRDERDASRSASPLKAAADAVVIDTSDLDINGVCDRVIALIPHHLLP
ncbi:MAG: (d)CMP kinase, partial [Gammaproteobacteria bacterium]|nr:(d)CMP kinase [Gammaproteobacteria bacterium]